jgi:hypothetical protein
VGLIARDPTSPPLFCSSQEAKQQKCPDPSEFGKVSFSQVCCVLVPSPSPPTFLFVACVESVDAVVRFRRCSQRATPTARHARTQTSYILSPVVCAQPSTPPQSIQSKLSDKPRSPRPPKKATRDHKSQLISRPSGRPSTRARRCTLWPSPTCGRRRDSSRSGPSDLCHHTSPTTASTAMNDADDDTDSTSGTTPRIFLGKLRLLQLALGAGPRRTRTWTMCTASPNCSRATSDCS